MAKHFNLRIFTTTLHSCRSKDPSDLPENPVSSASISAAACGLPGVNNSPPPKLKWQVVAEIYDPPSPRRKICSSSDDDLPFALLPPPPVENSKRINKKRRVSKRRFTEPAAAADLEIPARLSVFMKLIQCSVDGKVKESFAIVKKSEDPYEDFKDSMMDMILQKQIIARKDLEQLLECFLSLNSRRYHGVIVHAFSEIWEAIFSRSGRPAGVKLASV